MEVSHREGMVTMRMGPEDGEPVRLAVPARQAGSLLEGLRAMRLDAEETDWTQIASGDVAKQRQGVPFSVVLAEEQMLVDRPLAARIRYVRRWLEALPWRTSRPGTPIRPESGARPR